MLNSCLIRVKTEGTEDAWRRHRLLIYIATCIPVSSELPDFEPGYLLFQLCDPAFNGPLLKIQHVSDRNGNYYIKARYYHH